ncbi:hypothetical protein SCHPADRAFT_996076 [Schizopora paradoxa]|uniref:Uncharacterized protein n=1 Tax=Schizopora paradoxa TaxID=27342 RepID=A0A0H2RTE4_9AGAM|nr:hypothetical protein SCHPADRAFT_996076 [Schizopora paradoxa]
MGGMPAGGISVEEDGLFRLLAALEILKESGCKQQDARSMWCPGWVTATKDTDIRTEDKVESAKKALRELKFIKRALVTATESLDETFERVTEESSNIIRSSGLTSLPDEVLARVFEMNHEVYAEFIKNCGTSFRNSTFVCSSNVLAQVCRRFRHIAIHIPSLWEVVSNSHAKEWVAAVKERCRDPAICVEYHVKGARKSISDLLQLTHPANRWKTLDARFNKRKDGSDFIGRICAASGGHLPSLQRLLLRIEFDRRETDGDDGGEEDDVDMEDEGTFTNLSESDSSLLSTWTLPKVSGLTLLNLIPSRMDCHAVRNCEIELRHVDEVQYWNLHALKGFLGCLPVVESLSFTFKNAFSNGEADFSVANPIVFPHLKSLDVSVNDNTEEALVRGVMDMINTTTITDLTVSICPVSFHENIDPEEKRREWLGAIFHLKSMWGHRRLFPNVEVFCFALHDGPSLVDYGDMFDALPRAKDITLKLPGCYEPDLPSDGLNDLRCFHLKKNYLYGSDATLKFFKERISLGNINIEKVEIDGCYSYRNTRAGLQKMLGEKFIWKE